MKTLWHTTSIYMHPKIFEYSQKLSAKLPGNLNVVYFVNSGSEANDLAILLARLYTKNYDIISLKNAYHGASTSTMGLTGIGFEAFGSRLEHVDELNLNPCLDFSSSFPIILSESQLNRRGAIRCLDSPTA